MGLSSLEQVQFGLCKEASRGTAETTPTKWYPVDKSSQLDYALALLKDENLRGSPEEFPPNAGVKTGTGKIKMPLDAQNCGEFLYSNLGGVSSAEQTAITITSSNKHIDFNIGASDLDAQIATGDYVIGTTSATASTLCKAIKDALLAADATGTYTVTYSRTTQKFSIIRSTGTFNIKWVTGTNVANGAATTLGYTADDTGLLTYVSDSQVKYAFKHTFTRGTSIQRTAYTLFMDRGLSVKKYNLGTTKKFMITVPVDNLITMEADVLFKTEASGSIGSPAYPTNAFLGFNHATIKIGGVANTDIHNLQVSFDNSAKLQRTLSQSQDGADILAAGKFMIDGSFTIFFQDEVERAKFLANTSNTLQVTMAGDTIQGTYKYTVDLNLYRIHYKAYPFGEQEGLLAAKVDFTGVYSSTDSKAIQVDVTNQDVSY
jgi:hypothetical protein